MIAFYAIGGGFGHLTRVRNFINRLEIGEIFIVITNSEYSKELFQPEQLFIIPSNITDSKEKLSLTIEKFLEEEAVDTLYMDVFPNGILGEITSDLTEGISVNYIARRLKWNAYLPYFSGQNFYRTYLLEDLEIEHWRYVENHSEEIIRLDPLDFTESTQFELENQTKEIWLIVHSSDQGELHLLIDHARDISLIEKCSPNFVIISDQEPLDKRLDWRKGENPANWFHMAQKIFTAAGFNSWYQLAPFREKHICLPFDRKFDDQFWRAQQ